MSVEEDRLPELCMHQFRPGYWCTKPPKHEGAHFVSKFMITMDEETAKSLNFQESEFVTIKGEGVIMKLNDAESERVQAETKRLNAETERLQALTALLQAELAQLKEKQNG